MSCLSCIEDDDDLGYKGAESLPLISRVSNLSISNHLSIETCLLRPLKPDPLGVTRSSLYKFKGRFTYRV